MSSVKIMHINYIISSYFILNIFFKNIPSVDFVRVCPYATLGPLQMAKFSASIQLSPFPGHCSQKLFFLFPIPTSLFFINSHLSCSGAKPPTPGQILSTLSRLLRQAEICFRPILYDARDSHRAFGKQHLEKCPLLKLCTLTI
jgi:hypothetical protein